MLKKSLEKCWESFNPIIPDISVSVRSVVDIKLIA